MTQEEIDAMLKRMNEFIYEAYLDTQDYPGPVTSTKFQSLVLMSEIIHDAIRESRQRQCIRMLASKETIQN